MKNKQGFLYLVCMFLIMLIPLMVVAQPDPGDDPDAVPIDGGLSLLIAAGLGYGAKKVYDARKKGGENKD